jgi:HEPN domain-containing protein
VAITSAVAPQLPLRKTRRDFQRLANLRAKEAVDLAKAGKQQGAYYLGGLAVECALKACIAKKTRRHDFPDAKYAAKAYTHNLEELLKLADLDAELDREVRNKRQLGINWGVFKSWNVDSRYETSGLDGRDMVSAVSSPEGVLQWIKLHW